LFLSTFAAFSATLFLVDEHIIAATWIVRFAILYLLTFITSFLSRELIDQNAELESEVARHRATEAQLRQSEADLEEAQAIAHLGSWSWDVVDNKITWSDELFRIYDMSPEDFTGDYASFLDRVHEEDRGRLNAAVQEALDTNGNFSLQHRIRRSDGELRIVQASGGVESVDGKPLRMVGTAVDITERKRLEETERRMRELQVRQQQAVEINDNVVQGLAVASYALGAGDQAKAQEAVKRTLEAARAIVNGLLDVDALRPGDLVRSRSASVIGDGEEKDAG
jgi:PAS domain S-box-containing protein